MLCHRRTLRVSRVGWPLHHCFAFCMTVNLMGHTVKVIFGRAEVDMKFGNMMGNENC